MRSVATPPPLVTPKNGSLTASPVVLNEIGGIAPLLPPFEPMKTLLTRIAAFAFILSLTTQGFAAQNPVQGAKPAAEATPAETKTMPMYCRADAIDLAAKTFTLKRKDG